jgi:hypothetical protein
LIGLPDPANRASFLSTVRGKLINALVIITLVLCTAAEGVNAFLNTQEAIRTKAAADNATLRQHTLKAENERSGSLKLLKR